MNGLGFNCRVLRCNVEGSAESGVVYESGLKRTVLKVDGRAKMDGHSSQSGLLEGPSTFNQKDRPILTLLTVQFQFKRPPVFAYRTVHFRRPSTLSPFSTVQLGI